jgi:hypothetical protein
MGSFISGLAPLHSSVDVEGVRQIVTLRDPLMLSGSTAS